MGGFSLGRRRCSIRQSARNNPLSVWGVLPTYNEADNLPLMAATLLQFDVMPPQIAFQIEMATACERAGLRVAEFPISFKEHTRGQSKMSATIILDAVWRVWQGRLKG